MDHFVSLAASAASPSVRAKSYPNLWACAWSGKEFFRRDMSHSDNRLPNKTIVWGINIGDDADDQIKEQQVIFKTRFSIILVGVCLAAGAVSADDNGVRQDARAMDVLKKMSAYKETLDRVVIHSVSLTDARMGAGLMVSNSTEAKVSIDRPGSMLISSFDGVQNKELYFHDGTLTVFNSERGFYAQASIPREIEAAMEFALEELEVEAPLMDLIYRDASVHMIGSQETVLYLTDKARVAGTDCHHIAIRADEVDVQLWVEEGERPLVRKIMITSKWEGGSPRFVANIKWDVEPDFKSDLFEFKAPEGSINIGFAQDHKEGGE
jgi:hypothetical protein